jgi:hypothetical protein
MYTGLLSAYTLWCLCSLASTPDDQARLCAPARQVIVSLTTDEYHRALPGRRLRGGTKTTAEAAIQ